jgi:hypothetical protein
VHDFFALAEDFLDLALVNGFSGELR